MTRIVSWALFLALCAAFLVGMAQLAMADHPNCAPRASALAQLAEKWDETRRSVMLASNGRVFETWANDETGTWTILRTTPDGVSCIVASGIAYEHVPVVEGDPA